VLLPLFENLLPQFPNEVPSLGILVVRQDLLYALQVTLRRE
jgi:hypothetical protein